MTEGYRSRYQISSSLGLTYAEIAREVRVDVKTCKKAITKCINTGSISPGKSTGRKANVSNLDNVEFIENLKLILPSVTAKKVQQDLVNLGAESVPGLSTINRIIRDKLGYTFKKIQIIPAESEREDIQLRLFEFMATMSNTNPATLHFLDESYYIL